MKGTEYFSNLKDRDLESEGLVVGEGHFIVERMIGAGLEILSVLCVSSVGERYERLSGGRFPVYRADERAMSEIAGFRFHRGVLAAAVRPSLRPVSAAPVPGAAPTVVCPRIGESENVGSIVRSAAAFGLSCILLGEASADPFSRKAIRASMGAVFRFPVFRIGDEEADIRFLKERGVFLAGAEVPENLETVESAPERDFADVRQPVADAGTCRPVLRPDLLPALATERGKRSIAIVLGNEAFGIPERWRRSCDAFTGIPMKNGIDSLNVGTAAGILFYALSIPTDTW